MKHQVYWSFFVPWHRWGREKVVKVNLQRLKIIVRQQWLMRNLKFPENLSLPRLSPCLSNLFTSRFCLRTVRECPCLPFTHCLRTVNLLFIFLLAILFSTFNLSVSCSSQHVIEGQAWNHYQMVFNPLWLKS